MINSINNFERSSIKKAYRGMYDSKKTQINESVDNANECGGVSENDSSSLTAQSMDDEVVIWDNGGETWDRYTVTFPNYGGETWGMDEHPSHPQGFGTYSGDFSVEHLDSCEKIGKRISFAELPEACQKFVNGLLEQFKNEDDEPTDEIETPDGGSVDEANTTNLLPKSEELREKSKILEQQIVKIAEISQNGIEKVSNSVELLDYLSAAADSLRKTADSMVAEISKYR